MALPPKFAAYKLSSAPAPQTLHTLEVYLDYVCPYSAKMFRTLHTSVAPLIATKYPTKVAIIFRTQVQPWHPSSTLTHEAGLAVAKLAPGKFFDFSAKLFEEQKDFFDVNVVNETRNETYKRLVKVGGAVGVDEGKMFELLKISDKPAEDGSLNTGNGVTNDLKVLVKMARLVGVHVSPTVIWDGVVENAVSSGWTADQWAEWLETKVE